VWPPRRTFVARSRAFAVDMCTPVGTRVVTGEALAVRPDQRLPQVLGRGDRGGSIAEAEGIVLSASGIGDGPQSISKRGERA
jgi:hypothetical protein